MLAALLLLAVTVGSVVFNFMSPWGFTDIASNWILIDITVFITFWLCGIAFVILGLYMAWWVWRYEYKPGHLAEYEPENPRLESILTILTTIGVVVMLAPGLVAWDDYVNVPPDATELEVNSEQWRWSYRLPGEDGVFGQAHNKYISFENPIGILEDDPETEEIEFDPYGEDDIIILSSTIKVPLDRKVKVLLRSKDVLHDFWVPEIRAKMDSVPGMVTYFWFQPTRVGEFEVLCAELCGRSHHSMRGELHVVELAEYQDWLGAQVTWAEMKAGAKPLDPQALKGRNVAEANGCFACHSLDGSAAVGPSWLEMWGRTVTLTDGSSVTVDEEYVRESIIDPTAKLVEGFSPTMVPYTLPDDEMDALVEYLKSTAPQASSSESAVETET